MAKKSADMNDDRGTDFVRHCEYWEWHYDAQRQEVCDLIAKSIAVKEMQEAINEELIASYRRGVKLDLQREEVAQRLKMGEASNKHFQEYAAKGFVMKKIVRFE